MTPEQKQVYLGWLNNHRGYFHDLKLTCMEKRPDGSMFTSKKHNFLDICDDVWWMKKINNRTTLAQEIVIDVDNPLYIVTSKLQLDRLGVKYLLFQSNSGTHAHFWCPDLVWLTTRQREHVKQRIIRFCFGDPMLAYENHTISLEFTPHWKSGKVKQLINNGKNWLQITKKGTFSLNCLSKPLYRMNSYVNIINKIDWFEKEC